MVLVMRSCLFSGTNISAVYIGVNCFVCLTQYLTVLIIHKHQHYSNKFQSYRYLTPPTGINKRINFNKKTLQWTKLPLKFHSIQIFN